MSKYVRGVSHSLHQEHGFSWRRFAARDSGIYIFGSISMKKRFCARSWACWFWTDWHSVVIRQFKRFQ